MWLATVSQRFIAPMALACLAATPLAAHAAREVLLDLPGSDYSLNGQSWGNYTTSTPFSNTLGGFATGATSETILNTGDILFLPTLFSFQPLHLPTGQIFILNPADSLSALGINVGQVDARVFDPTLINDHDPVLHPYNNSFDAARYNYNNVCVSSNGTTCTGGAFTFQVIDVRLSPKVDVLEFNYAFTQGPLGATAGFSVGPYSATFTPSFLTGPALCLNNGTQSTFLSIQSCLGTTAVVPEPEVPALLALGTLGLALGLRRRRSSNLRAVAD